MKVLVIGAGSIGARHLRNLLGLGIKNVAIADPDTGKLRALSGIGKVALYQNAENALESVKPEIVFICTPTNLHLSIASRALESGANVFIEKPLSHSIKGIRKFSAIAERSKKTVMVACNYLFHSGFRKLQKILQSKKYGVPISCSVTLGYYLPSARAEKQYKNIYAAKKKEGGDVVLDSGSHVLIYLRALFGNIKKTCRISSPLHAIGLESEEAAILAFEHVSGVVSSASLDYVSRKNIHRLEVVAEKGRITLDFRENVLIFEDEKSKKEIYRGSRDLNLMFIEELKYFLACVKSGEKPVQDAILGGEVVRLLFK